MIVLLTGATGHLGPAVRQAFESRGDRVIAVARKGDIPADLTRAGEADRVVAEVLKQHRQVDVLAHVLGGFAGGQPIENHSDETWAQMINLNLDAAFWMVRAALRAMKAAGRGRIIAVGSRAGVLPQAGIVAYNASKAGLNAVIQTVAQENKGTSITANVVLPSSIGDSGVPAAAIADYMVWLASDAAAHINGALLPMYGNA